MTNFEDPTDTENDTERVLAGSYHLFHLRGTVFTPRVLRTAFSNIVNE